MILRLRLPPYPALQLVTEVLVWRGAQAWQEMTEPIQFFQPLPQQEAEVVEHQLSHKLAKTVALAVADVMSVALAVMEQQDKEIMEGLIPWLLHYTEVLVAAVLVQ